MGIEINVSLPTANELASVPNSRTRRMIGAFEHEIRIPLDPNDPDSDFFVVLPVASTETVRDPITYQTLAQKLTELSNSVGNGGGSGGGATVGPTPPEGVLIQGQIWIDEYSVARYWTGEEWRPLAAVWSEG